METRLTRMFGLQYPIVLAPMGGVSGGRLAAAVSNAGALGLVGGGYGDAAWLRLELACVKKETAHPWGVGFITWSVDRSLIELALEYEPHALMLSFGDPKPYANLIRSSGCKLICQVQDLEGARVAQEAGADLIVAQGSEAGGHGASRAILPLVPAVVDAVASTQAWKPSARTSRSSASCKRTATRRRALVCSTSCASSAGRKRIPGARCATASSSDGMAARASWRRLSWMSKRRTPMLCVGPTSTRRWCGPVRPSI
jgi:hypothetical protein